MINYETKKELRDQVSKFVEKNKLTATTPITTKDRNMFCFKGTFLSVPESKILTAEKAVKIY